MQQMVQSNQELPAGGVCAHVVCALIIQLPGHLCTPVSCHLRKQTVGISLPLQPPSCNLQAQNGKFLTKSIGNVFVKELASPETFWQVVQSLRPQRSTSKTICDWLKEMYAKVSRQKNNNLELTGHFLAISTVAKDAAPKSWINCCSSKCNLHTRPPIQRAFPAQRDDGGRRNVFNQTGHDMLISEVQRC